MMIRIEVDGTPLEVAEGTNLLAACLAAGIYVPNLCYMTGSPEPFAGCRLCFVEIQGQPAPVTACTVTVADGMVVQTATAPVRRLQQSAFRLIISAHRIVADCPAHKQCALQQVARHLHMGLKPKPLERIPRELEIDTSPPFFDLHPARCVLCGKCLRACQAHHGHALLTFARRGIQTVISAQGLTASDQDFACEGCLACADVCPVSAITPKAAGAQPPEAERRREDSQTPGC
ncbi:MAG: 2Fe-2S iron-sulfur cluster-binding protein [Desulfobacterales bacterium]